MKNKKEDPTPALPPQKNQIKQNVNLTSSWIFFKIFITCNLHLHISLLEINDVVSVPDTINNNQPQSSETSIMMSAYRASINNDQPQSSETSFMMSAYWTAPPTINSREANCPSCCQPTGHPS